MAIQNKSMCIDPTAMRDQQRNALLAALWPADWPPHVSLEAVELSCGRVLCESCEPYLYFPTTAIVSVLYVTECGASTEIAVIGNDGVVGLSMFSNSNTQPIQARVQSAGRAYRASGQLARMAADHDSPILDMLSRYSQAMNAQLAQTAVCNRHHSIDQQLCRRLLLGLDRSHSNELAMSHQLVADLLGVRRESVTVAAQRLQAAGIIRYRRGRLTVLDRGQLERRACECYATLQKVYRRLLPGRPLTAVGVGAVPVGRARDRALVTRRNRSEPSLLLCRI